MKMLKIIAILFAMMLIYGCGGEVMPYDRTVPVLGESSAQSLSEITISGVVESVTSRNVYSTLGQIVERVYVEVGDRVTEGQTLAELDVDVLALTIAQQAANAELARHNLEEAERNLRGNSSPHVLNARAALEAAEINLTETRRALNNARSDSEGGNVMQVLAALNELNHARIDLEELERIHERLEIMFEAGAMSQNDFRHAENNLTLARRRYETAQSNYETTTTATDRSLEQLEALYRSAVDSHSLAREMLNAATSGASQETEMLSAAALAAETSLQILDRQLSDSMIRSPINGTVTAKFAAEGSVGMGLMFVVEDMEELVVKARIREYDLSLISEGMEVKITSDAIGNVTHTGVITHISPAAVLGSPVTEFEIEVRLTSPISDLRIGMNARVHIGLN